MPWVSPGLGGATSVPPEVDCPAPTAAGPPELERSPLREPPPRSPAAARDVEVAARKGALVFGAGPAPAGEGSSEAGDGKSEAIAILGPAAVPVGAEEVTGSGAAAASLGASEVPGRSAMGAAATMVGVALWAEVEGFGAAGASTTGVGATAGVGRASATTSATTGSAS